MTNCCPESLSSDSQACCQRLEQTLQPQFFKALAETNRITLVAHLAALGHPSTVSEAACCCPVDLSVVSRHLAMLREAGVVSSEKSGKEVRYSISCEQLAATFREIADALDACCEGRVAACCSHDHHGSERKGP